MIKYLPVNFYGPEIAGTAVAKLEDGMFLQDGPGAVPQTNQDKMRESVSVKDFGATGNGSTDDTASIQACLAYANSIGATAYFPPGDYRVTSSLTIDNTGDTAQTAPKASIKGSGKTSSRILADAGNYSVIQLLGGTASSGMHSHQEIESISITKSGANGTGVYLSNIAYFVMRDVLITGANVGLLGEDVLSSYVAGCQFLFNTRGVDFTRQPVTDGYQSGPNALTFVGCVFGNNGNSGAYFAQGGCINFIGGSVEGNGISGSGTSNYKFGILVSNSGLESAVGLNIVGTYFEHNKGTADVWIANSSYSVSHSITGATFNRAISTDFVTHNIYVETSGSISADVRLNGCGFKHLGTYIPSGARLTVHQVASSGARNRISWDGCYFSSATDFPIVRNYSANVAAYGAVNAAGALLGDKMNVASVTKNGTGDYTITYAQPLENSRHVSVATPLTDVVPYVFGIDATLVRFRFGLRATGVLTDTDFSFVSMGR